MSTGTDGLWRPWPLRELVSDLASGRRSPSDALARSTARTEATEPQIGAWVQRSADAGPLSDGPLAGVTMGVKDIIDVAGYATRCGSLLRADASPAEQNAPIVDAWIAAGATPVGKTVTTEFAFLTPGPTRNPANTDHTPGGSSSGSAAAVSAGHVPLALGTQTAGSVTRPGAFCGIASLVMTHGAFSVDGVVGLSTSLDSHGMYTATVSDLALAWSALTGETDAGLAESPPPRILLWSAEPLGAVSPEMAAAVGAATEGLRAAGATIEAFGDEKLVAEVSAAHLVVMSYEASRERAEELARADLVSEPFATLLRTGAATSDEAYAAARATIAGARRRVDELMDGYDAIFGPGAPGAAPAGLGATGDPILSRPWQAFGLPAVGIPGLRNTAGLPLGLQLIGRAGDEVGVLTTGSWIEAHL